MKKKYIKELSDDLVNYLLDELETEKRRVLQCMLDDNFESRDGVYPTISNLLIINETIYHIANEQGYFEDFLATHNMTEYHFKKAILNMMDYDELSEDMYSELAVFMSNNFNKSLLAYTD